MALIGDHTLRFHVIDGAIAMDVIRPGNPILRLTMTVAIASQVRDLLDDQLATIDGPNKRAWAEAKALIAKVARV